MPPRVKGRSIELAAANGPHAGQASIRKAYEALGVQHFYATHGARYTNPHEAQIFAAVSQLLDDIPADVWLGMRELEPFDEAGGDSDEAGDDEIGTDMDCHQRNTFPARMPHHGYQKDDHSSFNRRTINPYFQSEDKATTEVLASDRTAGAGSAAADFGASRQSGTGPVSGGVASAPPIAMASSSSELVPPVPLRILDLACGSGEATVAIVDWNLRHPVIEGPPAMPAAAAAAVMAAPARFNAAAVAAAAASATDAPNKSTAEKQPVKGKHQQHQRQQSHGLMQHCHCDTAMALAELVLPYKLHITACDPYTGAAYLQRTGCTALQWSFEDIADGCLADWDPKEEDPAAMAAGSCCTAGVAAAALVMQQPSAAYGYPHFDLIICSFALHLCDSSRLHGTCTALSLAGRWLAVLAPHKRPVLGPELGWQLVFAWKVERTHLRLYRSQRVPPGAI
ncbi:hypothetical protein Vretimale_7303 [Volvox reticuliferus]|uniref:Methyltransferase domain-containing protein n=1 Tax=Volvox reticuliferus TaxID=1737510 RepID=A0A8J4G949_9CHLO|nr:hypothetical protein Vretimale_7303 [Volvox reticuliferus]